VDRDAWLALGAEGVGTFLFFFVGAGSILAGAGILTGATGSPDLVAVALAHGIGLAVLVSLFGPIRGGPLHPGGDVRRVARRAHPDGARPLVRVGPARRRPRGRSGSLPRLRRRRSSGWSGRAGPRARARAARRYRRGGDAHHGPALRRLRAGDA